jgi:hypothetical protein
MKKEIITVRFTTLLSFAFLLIYHTINSLIYPFLDKMWNKLLILQHVYHSWGFSIIKHIFLSIIETEKVFGHSFAIFWFTQNSSFIYSNIKNHRIHQIDLRNLWIKYLNFFSKLKQKFIIPPGHSCLSFQDIFWKYRIYFKRSVFGCFDRFTIIECLWQ